MGCKTTGIVIYIYMCVYKILGQNRSWRKNSGKKKINKLGTPTTQIFELRYSCYTILYIYTYILYIQIDRQNLLFLQENQISEKWKKKVKVKRKNILKIKQPFVVKRQGRRERHAFFDTIFLLPIVRFFYITCTITMYINFFLFNKIPLLSFFLLVDY